MNHWNKGKEKKRKKHNVPWSRSPDICSCLSRQTHAVVWWWCYATCMAGDHSCCVHRSFFWWRELINMLQSIPTFYNHNTHKTIWVIYIYVMYTTIRKRPTFRIVYSSGHGRESGTARLIDPICTTHSPHHTSTHMATKKKWHRFLISTPSRGRGGSFELWSAALVAAWKAFKTHISMHSVLPQRWTTTTTAIRYRSTFLSIHSLNVSSFRSVWIGSWGGTARRLTNHRLLAPIHMHYATKYMFLNNNNSHARLHLHLSSSSNMPSLISLFCWWAWITIYK